VIPVKYEVRKLAQWILQDSTAAGTIEEELGKMGRPTFIRLEYDSESELRRSVRRTRLKGVQKHADDRRGQSEESEGDATHDSVTHLQGFDPVVKIANMERQHAPSNPPDPRATREQRRRRPPRYKNRCKACGKFGHEETRCEFLALYLSCRWFMKDRTEMEIQSVFDHWNERNQDDVTYVGMRRKLDDRGMSVRRMTSEMDWAFFVPLSREECFELDEGTDTSDSNNGDE
jgi:hypothetical protein